MCNFERTFFQYILLDGLISSDDAILGNTPSHAEQDG